MALVSYVDILEVVGELKDFKVKLVEGEGIAQVGGITGLSVEVKEEGACVISAKCQPPLEECESYDISISIINEPRILDCKCSCLEGKSGKCQHVVATLMHIHRNNISAERFCSNLKEDSGIRKQKHYAINSASGIVHDSLQASGLSQNSVGVLDAKKVNSSKDRKDFPDEAPNHSYQSVSKVTSMDVEIDTGFLEDFERVNKTASVNDDAKIEDIWNATDKRMGRGHRKTIPNPKYISESKKFSCTVCSKGFAKKAHYEEHLRSHTGEKPFVCEVCGQGYAQKRTLLRHGEGGCQTPVTVKCKMCDASFKSQCQLDDHLLSHSTYDYKCPYCEKSFNQKNDLEAHQLTHREESSKSQSVGKEELENEDFMCDACGKRFKKRTQLTQHKRRTHSKDKPFKCLECGKSFTRQRTFKAHKHNTEGDRSLDSPSVNRVAKKRAIIKCETCGKEFTNRVHHEEHVRSHTGERPFQCVECGKCFATKRSLRNHCHAGKDARSRPHMCSQCPATFTTGFMLKIHERGHTGERPYECAECGKCYRSQHIYQDHLNQHKGLKAHTCKECGKSFTWRTSLWAHTRDHAKEKPFECVQCGSKFAEQSQLKDHWEFHLDDKPFQCPECGLGFMLEADCEKHVEFHKKPPSQASYSCDKCDRKFVWADELNRHKSAHKEKKRSLCPTCGQTFSSKGHLKVHMMIHTGEKPYECETCHKRFYTRSLMRKHAVFHSNERPFECVLCGDKFPTQGILRAHIRTHTGEKPFSCGLCGKAFPQSSYLKRHQLTHTGDRPFQCSKCESAFMTRYDLKVHTRTHTGNRPFSCDECNEQFYERTQLTAHLRTHTGERPFVCDLCGKGFNSSNHIKKHFSRVHPDVAPFSCSGCGERFMMCEALRKHRKHSDCSGIHLGGQSEEQNDSPQEETTEDSPLVLKDPLNRLIEDSQIFVEDTSSASCDIETEAAPVLTQEYEIVQVNLVDSSGLIKLPEGYRCETVEVYHAESLENFEGKCEFQAVSITSLPPKIEVVPQEASLITGNSRT